MLRGVDDYGYTQNEDSGGGTRDRSSADVENLPKRKSSWILLDRDDHVDVDVIAAGERARKPSHSLSLFKKI